MTEEDDIIYPPPELKQVADKTAGAVAKNGPGFEDRLREKELHNPRFCFLNPNDPFHKYYQKKLKDINEGIEEEKKAALPKKEEPIKAIPLPPPAFEYYVDFPLISKQDLEILKLTAQFVAKKGTPFMTSLSQREERNSQFDFLRPSHSFYGYFMNLVAQYSKILNPPPHLPKYLEINVTDKYLVLDRITKRLEFEAYVASEKERVQQEVDEERIAFATIDWHDFVVVETIEFTDADNRAVLPLPPLLSELQSMTLEQRKELLNFDQPEEEAEEDMPIEDVDMGVVEEEVPMVHNVPKPAYVPKGGKYQQPMQICPRCNAKVKASEMTEHTKICLYDPRTKEMQQAYQSKIEKTNVLQQGDEVAENLKRMTQFRSDIFGGSDVAINQKLAFEADRAKEIKETKVIWDGKSSSAASATAKMQMLSQSNEGPDTKRPRIDPNSNALQIYITLPNGQSLFLNDLTPLWTVSQLKERLVGPSGLSVSKQKLIAKSGAVMRNAATLLEFGVQTGDTLTLTHKDKGKK